MDRGGIIRKNGPTPLHKAGSVNGAAKVRDFFSIFIYRSVSQGYLLTRKNKLAVASYVYYDFEFTSIMSKSVEFEICTIYIVF